MNNELHMWIGFFTGIILIIQIFIAGISAGEEKHIQWNTKRNAAKSLVIICIPLVGLAYLGFCWLFDWWTSLPDE